MAQQNERSFYLGICCGAVKPQGTKTQKPPITGL
jgi:hypothetical protein